MPHCIRTTIYRSDIFRPTNGGGYSIDAFYHYSDELIEYPFEALEFELKCLLREGYLSQEGDQNYYWATTAGKIACRKHLAQIGMLSKPLTDQQCYTVCDLVVAILASNRIVPFSGSDNLSLEALSIYLCDYSYEEIEKAKLELESAGLLREVGMVHGKSVCLTGRGLQIYKTDIRFKLKLGPFEGVLGFVEAPEKDARFERLGFDKDLQGNLEHRWFEMEACAGSAAYLAAVILLGSILEGALLAKLKANIKAAMSSQKAPKDKLGAVKPVDDWKLSDHIAVCTELGFVPKSVEKHSHELRDTRNLVHPRKQVSEQITVDESLYRISREVAETVIDALSS